MAPAWRAITLPSRSTISVGMAWTVNRCCSFGASSTLTLTSFTVPTRSWGELLQRGADGAAGPAPGRPHVHHDGDGGRFGDLGERVVARGGNPGQRLVAVAAPGGSARGGRNPVHPAPVRAPDQLRWRAALSVWHAVAPTRGSRS